VRDRVRPNENVYTTVHEVHSTSELNLAYTVSYNHHTNKYDSYMAKYVSHSLVRVHTVSMSISLIMFSNSPIMSSVASAFFIILIKVFLKLLKM